MKRTWFRIAVISVVMLAFSFESFGQIRIRFARGRTSATTSGTLGGNGTRSYVVGARRGQDFSGNVSSRNGCVKFTEGGTSVGFTTDAGSNYFSITNYCTRATTFTMTISIY